MMRPRLLLLAAMAACTSSFAFSPAPKTTSLMLNGVRYHQHHSSLVGMFMSSVDTTSQQAGSNETAVSNNDLESEQANVKDTVTETSSISDDEPLLPPAANQDATKPTSSSNGKDTTALWSQLLSIASRTGRGEFATVADKQQALNLIQELESLNPTTSPTISSDIQGTWELVYSDTQLFRGSPFFMAGRAVCETEEQAQQYDWFCDMHRQALSISNIGAVRQVISTTKLVSEFETNVGAIPFVGARPPFAYSGGLPLTIQGAIVSTADIDSTLDGSGWELYMDTVEIKGSNMPGLRQVLDGGLSLSSRSLASVLESTIDSYTTPKPIFTTTYLSATMRISRDQDGKVFIYTKVSDSSEPTDYSGKMADLGVSKLLEGFNDAITKFYL